MNTALSVVFPLVRREIVFHLPPFLTFYTVSILYPWVFPKGEAFCSASPLSVAFLSRRDFLFEFDISFECPHAPFGRGFGMVGLFFLSPLNPLELFGQN